MIFVTVGTDHHPFKRVFEWLREAVDQAIISHDERLVVQSGYTEIDWSRAEVHQFLSFEEMMRLFEDASLVITHGSSTALLVIHHGKCPVVIPRRKVFGEHIDDHQWAFVQETRGVLPFFVIETKNELFDLLRNRDRVKARSPRLVVGGESARRVFKQYFDELFSD
jgi:UDP-N-acetylglucosamine transferase subunit ALG13